MTPSYLITNVQSNCIIFIFLFLSYDMFTVLEIVYGEVWVKTQQCCSAAR